MTIDMTAPEVLTTPQPQDDDVILSVNGVSKKFCRNLKKSLWYGVRDITAEVTGTREKEDTLRSQEFWALKDVSFELRRGQALGLIGKNGSGKSTLLRIISGLIKPDTGTIEVNGRVAPLIALGAGFNPILTGRENIYANMSVLGLSRQEIAERFDEVVEFAEIGDAINAPVQTYSSGMGARLGFACAIHTKPEILLMDEVLAVGDLRFRYKCYRMLNELQRGGTSFVLVSHNANSILAMCDTAVYLDSGNLIETGPVEPVVNRYERDLFMVEAQRTTGKVVLPEKTKDQSLGLDILSLSFKDENGKQIDSLISGKPASFCVEYVAHEPIEDICIDVLIKDQLGEGDWMLRLSNRTDNHIINVSAGQQEAQLQMPYTCLRPGLYIMKLSFRRDRLYFLDGVESFRFVVVESESMTNCHFYQPRTWEIIHQSDVE